MSLFDNLFGHPSSTYTPYKNYGPMATSILAQQQGLANYVYPKPRPRRMLAADIGMREVLVPLEDIPQQLRTKK